MNEIIKNIMSRRSIRSFTNKKISDEIINTLLQSAICAPSAKNGQTWFFSVVQNKEILDKIDSVVECIRGGNIFYNANTVIFVAMQSDSKWGETDCAAATQNILLTANSLGLGSCWIGCCREELQGENASEYKRLMKIPEDYTLLYGIAIGYTDTTPTAPQRKQDNIAFVK